MIFKTAFFLFLITGVFIQAGFGQRTLITIVLPESAATLDGFVPAGWKLAGQLEGDLDADGKSEFILVLQGANRELIKQADLPDYNLRTTDEKTGDLKFWADNNPVVLAVLKKENDKYELIAQNDRLIPLFTGNWFRWKHSVALVRQTLIVELSGKVPSSIKDNFGEIKRIYKFQMRDAKFVLTAAEETSWSRAMLIRNGRKDRTQKFDFLKKKGSVMATISENKKPARASSKKIARMIAFEEVSADSIESMVSLASDAGR